MESKKVTVLRILHQMLWIWPLAYGLQSMFYRENVDLEWTSMWMLLPLIVVSFTWYEITYRFWTYMLLQPVIFILFLRMGSGNEFGFILAFMICIVLQLMEKRSKTLAIMNPNWAMCGVLAVIYLLCVMTGRETALGVIPYFLMGYIVVAVLFMNEVGMAEFMRMRQNVRNVAYGQLRRGNQTFIFGVIALASILFIIASTFMDNSLVFWLLGKIRDGLKAFIKMLEGMDWGDKEVVRETMEDLSNEPLADENGNPLDSGNTGQGFPEMMYYILGTVLTVFLLIVFIKGLIGLISLLTERFKIKKEEDIFEDEDTVDEVISIRPKGRRLLVKPAKNPEEKVRRIYKKVITKARKSKGMDVPDASYTPMELESESFGPNGIEGQEKLHSIYEKARYSQLGVTEADEREIKGIG